jgi:hypothetical protein
METSLTFVSFFLLFISKIRHEKYGTEFYSRNIPAAKFENYHFSSRAHTSCHPKYGQQLILVSNTCKNVYFQYPVAAIGLLMKFYQW